MARQRSPGPDRDQRLHPQSARRHLTDQVADPLTAAGVPGEMLCIEITEDTAGAVTAPGWPRSRAATTM
jgi:hypothetical protein